MGVLQELFKWFQNPHNVVFSEKTLEEIQSDGDTHHPEVSDLWTSAVYLAICFLLFRSLFIEIVFKPLGILLGVPYTKAIKPAENSTLEAIFCSCGPLPPNAVIAKAALELKLSCRDVERWLKCRASYSKTSKLYKFSDCSWQLLYYLFYCCFGILVLIDKKWLWDIKYCWDGYPNHNLSEGIRWYYLTSLGYYYSSFLTYSLQPKRKDTVLLFLHHIVTILLIWLSWITNLVRVGSLVLLVHECADIPLLLGKISTYCKKDNIASFFYGVFAIFWIVFRDGVYPIWIVRSAYFDSNMQNHLGYLFFVFIGLLVLLLVFHLFWTTFIVRVIIRKLNNKDFHDSRSDTESVSDDNSDTLDKKDI